MRIQASDQELKSFRLYFFQALLETKEKILQVLLKIIKTLELNPGEKTPKRCLKEREKK